MLPGLKDKVALVTGHKQGIGAACLDLLAEHGAKTFGLDLPEQDLSKSSAIPSYVDSVLEKAGQIDILVNNAGVTNIGDVVETPAEEIDWVLGVNLKAPILVMQSVIPSMLKNGGGAIVNISSDQAFIGKRHSAVYGASKAGIAQLTKSCALDWSPKGIRVNAVAPGSTKTPMLNDVVGKLKNKYPELFTTEAEEEYRRTIPLGRFAEPREIAWVVAFLASEASSFMTGAVVPVDGGFTIH